MSNLSVNPAKSLLFFSPNVPRQLDNQLSNVSGIPLTNNLGTYLGVPIVHGRMSRNLYSPTVEERFKMGISDMKAKLVSGMTGGSVINLLHKADFLEFIQQMKVHMSVTL